ncbi:M16 family metallopeptidase [Oceanithermus desulfurans]|uniref:Peptidase M16 n=2 Tax=Oceanithermus desulfurans TaxID=227924 RepID=A0A511RKT2_9DEIN|nr:pitrilysin family protein [Oceanithermus desulfurans]MBB6029628.1 putative Zn-dependent peptidase [Oceanithermus desulfurans]GEM89677.1 peptidase M16 [Oceanithermus desulfurans NBRC 100063]
MAAPVVHTLDNGLRVAVEPQPWNPGLSFTILVPVGATSDPEERLGAASMLETWLWKGAGPRGARAFADALDALGVRRQSGAGVEYTTFSASLLPEGFPAALELYADLLMRPHLPDDAFDSVRALALQELAALEDQPPRKLLGRLRRGAFASPHGQPVEGEREALERMTPDALREEYRRRYGAGGSILAVSGGVDPDEVFRIAEKHLGAWSGEAPPPPAVRLTVPHRFHIQQETEQVQIGLFYKDVPPGHYDYYASRLAVAVLSGGMSSRLFTEVREKRGLVYAVSASPGSVKGFGYLTAYAGTMPERAQATLEVMEEEIERLAQGVSREELDRAKVGVRADLVLSGESSRARAGALARDLFILERARSLEEVEAEVMDVTLERINAFLAGRPYRDPWIGSLGTVEVGA